MPTERNGAAVGVVNGRIYVIEGWGGWTRVEEYDPKTDSWTRKADMPTPRWDSAAAVVNDQIYVIGGMDGALKPFSTVDVYDPATDTWTEGTPMPTPRSTPGVCAVGNQIYVIGGARAWAWDFVGAVEVLDTGLPVPPQSVRPAGKLSTTWGEVKRGR